VSYGAETIFSIFWNGQMHVYFELARPDFGDYIIIIIIIISMQ